MTTVKTSGGSGLFSKLVVVVLLALAVGLYLKIVMIEGKAHYSAPAQQASLRVVEGNEKVASTPVQQALRDLPPEQMALIRQVFATEQAN
ncbi:MAG: hypothetical protein KDJ24_09805 [Gammaproteobacteria bacterium]|nr:hypothetical protein [Gammaproteobacteria bacterium]